MGIDVEFRVRETGKVIKIRVPGMGQRVRCMVDKVIYDTAASDALANNFYADGVNMFTDGKAMELYVDKEGRYFFAEYSDWVGVKDRITPVSASVAAAFIAAVGSAAETMVRLSAFVVFFTVVMALLASLFGTVPPLLAGFLELTVGVTSLTPHRLGFTMAAGLLGWGGVSVHCQAAAVLSDTDLSLRHYLLGKALQGLLSAAAAWWVYGLI